MSAFAGKLLIVRPLLETAAQIVRRPFEAGGAQVSAKALDLVRTDIVSGFTAQVAPAVDVHIESDRIDDLQDPIQSEFPVLLNMQDDAYGVLVDLKKRFPAVDVFPERLANTAHIVVRQMRGTKADLDDRAARNEFERHQKTVHVAGKEIGSGLNKRCIRDDFVGEIAHRRVPASVYSDAAITRIAVFRE